MPKYITLEWDEYQKLLDAGKPLESLKESVIKALDEPLEAPINSFYDQLPFDPVINGQHRFAELVRKRVRERVMAAIGQ